MTDILCTHIGLFETHCEAKFAGEFVDEAPQRQCYLGMRCEGRFVSEGHAKHKYSFDFSIGAKASHVEEFTVGSGMDVHTVSGGAKGIGQEEREDYSKECQGCFTLLLIGKESEVDPSKDTVPLMFSCGRRLTAGTDNFCPRGQTTGQKEDKGLEF